MRCYRIHDIEWDVDGDEVDVNLPSTVYMPLECNATLDELRDGQAADWLSDEYGFAVRALAVDEAEAKMYTVYIRRTETYDMPVNALARSGREAIDIVRAQNEDGVYDGTWDELQPRVTTKYDVAESEQPDRAEGPLA